MSDNNEEEIAREAFLDGYLHGLEMARRLLQYAGGTMDAPAFDGVRASKEAYKRAAERIRRRRYPKLKVAERDKDGGVAG